MVPAMPLPVLLLVPAIPALEAPLVFPEIALPLPALVAEIVADAALELLAEMAMLLPVLMSAPIPVPRVVSALSPGPVPSFSA